MPTHIPPSEYTLPGAILSQLFSETEVDHTGHIEILREVLVEVSSSLCVLSIFWSGNQTTELLSKAYLFNSQSLKSCASAGDFIEWYRTLAPLSQVRRSCFRIYAAYICLGYAISVQWNFSMSLDGLLIYACQYISSGQLYQPIDFSRFSIHVFC